jgi:prolyl-tRNA editing enzyme YbaK/EbsC (Cys-tRNA(Pro) deacylase)
MVQYVAKINTEKLNKEMKLYQNQHCENKAGKQHFHYRLVEEQQSQAMTGYEHNGVVPVLMKTRYACG